MDYGNPMYNPALYPYLGMYGQQAQQSIQKQEVVKVNGENGARAYQIGANSSALLLDESGVIVWLVTADGAGYKSVAPFDISPHKEAAPPDYESLASRITRLEEMIANESTNPANAEQNRADRNANTADTANDRHNKKYGQSTGNA